MACRLGSCFIHVAADPSREELSSWTAGEKGLEVSINVTDLDDHDAAMELLVCLGQALWDRLSEEESRSYWLLLRDEMGEDLDGEIDEAALDAKLALFKNQSNARLVAYGRASFAGTAAEYVHCLWHEVTVRTGPDHLPAEALRRRLLLLDRWFPPNRGYRLFP